MIRFQNLLGSITESVYEAEVAYKRQELFCKILERALLVEVFESEEAKSKNWSVDMKKANAFLASISREKLLSRHGIDKIIPPDRATFSLSEEKAVELELEALWNRLRNRMAAINVTIDVARSGLSYDKSEAENYAK
jgi:hypothetical protein